MKTLTAIACHYKREAFLVVILSKNMAIRKLRTLKMSKEAVITVILTSILVSNFWIDAKLASKQAKSKVDIFAKAKKESHTAPHSAKRQSRLTDYFNLNDPASAKGDIDVTNPDPGNSNNLSPADRTGQTDSTTALQAILNYTAQTSGMTVIYFPAGKYLVSSNLIIRGRVALMGSVNGISLLCTENTSALLTTISYERIAQDDYVDIDRLFFDAVRLEFNQEKVTISHCVFFLNENPPTQASLNNGQVRFSDIDNSDAHRPALSHSVFLRDERGFGVAVDVQSSVAIKIENNIFGLDLGRINWLDNVLGATYWPTLKLKLEFLKNELNLRGDQGYWKSSIYHGFNNDSVIQKNIFNGSPNFVRNGSVHKDHAVYLKAFRNLNFTENYVRGWDPDSTGGIKARNGENLVIARNYVDDTGILLYIHKEVKRPLPLFLRNVLVYGNHIVQRSNPGAQKSGISYMEPHQDFPDENLVYAGNVFEINGTDPTSKNCIFICTRANLNEHHVYKDNIYAGTTPFKHVNIYSFNGTLQLESGSASISRDYVDMTVPNYNITTYILDS